MTFPGKNDKKNTFWDVNESIYVQKVDVFNVKHVLTNIKIVL